MPQHARIICWARLFRFGPGIRLRSRAWLAFAASSWLCLFLAVTALAEGTVDGCSEEAFRAALAGGGLVTFEEDCDITLASPVVIDSETTIDAGGFEVILSGDDLVRLFTVAPGASLTLDGLTLTQGRSESGGAIYIDAGASAVLTNCTFLANNAAGTNGVTGANGRDSNTGSGGDGRPGTPGRPGFGGAIYNQGELVLLECVFSTNSVSGGAGGKGGNGGAGDWNGGNGGNGAAGAPAYGGAVYNLGTLSVRSCTFAGNSIAGGHGGTGGTNGTGAFPGLPGSGAAGGSASGAAVYSSGIITVLNSTFVANTARAGNAAAGGVEESGNGKDGARGVDALGGGISNAGEGTITNCTFYFNQVTGGNGGNGGSGSWSAGDGGNGGNGAGGGIYNSGVIEVVNCTLSTSGAVGGTNGLGGVGLSGGSNGKIGRSQGGNLANAGGTFWLKNTIVATNLSGGGGFGAITDGGNNISADKSLALGEDSKVNTDPLLGPLSNNGGPTRTMVPLPSSPAISAVDDAAAPEFDQRDFERPGPGKTRSDIGAVELQPPSITTQPQSTTRTNGGSATFSVVVSSDVPPRYQWRFNGTPIAQATNSTWTVSNLSASNTGSYDVVVSNFLGLVTSDPATLQILQAPSFIWTSVVTNAFVYAFSTQPGPAYVVQYKNSLTETNWTSLRTNLGSGAVVTNHDPLSATSPARFHRLLVR